MVLYRLWYSWLFIAVLAGCRCVEKPRNISLAHKEVITYYESGCFAREVGAVVDHGIRSIRAPAVSPRQVVIFDVDFTILDYFEYMKSIQFGYIPKLFHEWVLRADAPPMPHVKRLYDHCRALGYSIIFITERQPDEYEPTQKNLERVGCGIYDRLIIRSEALCQIPYITYKGCMRKGLEDEGYEVIASVSDQDQDFIGENVGLPVKIPNYLYALRYLQDAPS